VRRQARGEAQEAEDHVLDALLHVALPDRAALVGLLPREAQDHRHVVGAERPERVLVGAQHAQVEPVGVDVAHVAQLAAVHELLERLDARVVLEQVADHQHAIGRARRRHHLLGLLDRLGERLLDEAVLAGLQHPHRERSVRRHRRGQRDRVQRLVGQQLVQRGRHAGTGEGAPLTGPALLRLVAQPGQLGVRKPVEVARQVGAPVAESGDADPDHRAAGRAVIDGRGSGPRSRA
jgi:hypothetical protein